MKPNMTTMIKTTCGDCIICCPMCDSKLMPVLDSDGDFRGFTCTGMDCDYDIDKNYIDAFSFGIDWELDIR